MARKRKLDEHPCGCCGQFSGPWPLCVQARVERMSRAALEAWLVRMREDVAMTNAERELERRRRHLDQVRTEEESAYQT